jgi:hypothetical protein
MAGDGPIVAARRVHRWKSGAVLFEGRFTPSPVEAVLAGLPGNFLPEQ